MFGYFFAHRAEGLTGSEEDPDDPDFVAKICYTSAIVYAVFVVFCGLQVGTAESASQDVCAPGSVLGTLPQERSGTGPASPPAAVRHSDPTHFLPHSRA